MTTEVIKKIYQFIAILLVAGLFFEVSLSIFAPLLPSKVKLLLSNRVKATLSRDNMHEDTYICEGTYCQPKPFSVLEEVKSLGRVIIKHDEIGFYNPFLSYSKVEKFDIICIGDSFTHGNGRAVSYPEALREISNLRVLNLGIPGGTPQMSLETLKRYGISKTPAVVIYGLMHSNDLEDAVAYENFIKNKRPIKEYWSGGGPYSPRLVFSVDGIGRWLVYNSNIFGVAYNLFYRNLLSKKRVYLVKDIGKQSFTWGVPDIDTSANAREGLALTRQTILSMNKISEENGANFFIVLFEPASVVYYDNIVNKDNWIEEQRKNYEKFKNDMEAWAEANKINFVDITRALSHAAKENIEFLYEMDGNGAHMSDYGNKVIAKLLHGNVIKSF